MAKILLLHGYGVGVTYPFFRQALGPHAGFDAFGPQIDAGEAVVFRWDIAVTISLLNLLNPFAYLKLYRDEFALARSASLQARLGQVFSEAQPETIVCHSMGAALLLTYVEQHGLPGCVRRVVFSQADIDADYPVPSALHQRLTDGSLRLDNYHSWQDQALWSSAFIHRSWRAGLFGLRDARVRNHFFPLRRGPNWHTSAICDPEFRRIVLSESSAEGSGRL